MTTTANFATPAVPLPPLHTLDRSDRVLYLGTFSKSARARVSGSAISWSRLDRRRPLHGAQARLRPPGPGIDPAGPRALRERGSPGRAFAPHAHALYPRRRTELLSVLSSEAAGVLHVNDTPEVGLHIVARSCIAVDDLAVSRNSLSRKIYAAPLSSFYAGTSREHGFALGFAGTRESKIAPAVRHLVREVERVLSWDNPKLAGKSLKRRRSVEALAVPAAALTAT